MKTYRPFNNNENMFDKKSEKELKMVENALQDEQSKGDFKEYLRPLVEDIADKFVNNDHAKGISRRKLIEAGWTHFDFALKKYKMRADLILENKKDVFFFSTYFTWYIRQGIVEYLNSLKKTRN